MCRFGDGTRYGKKPTSRNGGAMKILGMICFIAVLFSVSPPVWARAVLCRQAESGSVVVDGLFSDWPDGAITRFSGRSGLIDQNVAKVPGAADFSVELSCLYTENRVYFRVKVTDDYIVRFKSLDFEQDHMILAFGDGDNVRKMAFFPPDGRVKPQFGWVGYKGKGRRRKVVLSRPKGVNAVMIRLRDGYALEMSMDNAVIPGYGFGSPAMRMSLAAADVDSRAHPEVKARMGTGGLEPANLGMIEFEGAKVLLSRYLDDHGLRPGDIRMRGVGNIISGKSRETVVVTRKKIGILGGDVPGGGYFYMRLPVYKPSDILRFLIRDMTGNGQDEILLRLRQMKDGHGREIYVIYRYYNRGLHVVFAHEVVHQSGDKILTNHYRYIRRGKGWDLEFTVDKNSGFTEQNHRSTQAKDIEPLLVPWKGRQKIRYRFTSEGYMEAE